MSKTYYKVVGKNQSSLILSRDSVVTKRAVKKYNTKYGINTWTKAKDNTRLFVFANKHDAFDYAQSWGGTVFTCHIKGGFLCEGLCVGKETTLTEIESFWDDFNVLLARKKGADYIYKRLRAKYYLSYAHPVFATEVKLLENIGDFLGNYWQND